MGNEGLAPLIMGNLMGKGSHSDNSGFGSGGTWCILIILFLLFLGGGGGLFGGGRPEARTAEFDAVLANQTQMKNQMSYDNINNDLRGLNEKINIASAGNNFNSQSMNTLMMDYVNKTQLSIVENTQRVLDKLNHDTEQNLRDRVFEMSQREQTTSIGIVINEAVDRAVARAIARATA